MFYISDTSFSLALTKIANIIFFENKSTVTTIFRTYKSGCYSKFKKPLLPSKFKVC